MSDRNRLLHLALPSGVGVMGLVAILSAYWPGVMIDDARWQYQQAVDHAYEAWHPPLMAWIWRRLMLVQPGPGPMLFLQAALYWFGFVLIALWIYQRGNPRLGVAASAAGWLPVPFALMGTVTKDCLMTGSLCSAVGLLLWSKAAKDEKTRMAFAAATIAALLISAALRANAFLACVPLALAVLPRSVTRSAPKLIAGTLLATGLLFLAPMTIARALHAEDTDPQLSLVIFDLGGITEHSGANQFPELHVANPVAVNHRCYDPFEWDTYSTWAARPCPLGFAPFQALVDEGDVDPRQIWLKAIVAHPLAYAEHRLAHFNLSTWFLVPNNPDPPAWTQSVNNPWNFRVQPNLLLKRIDGVANATARTPLGWPIFWLAVAMAVLILCWLCKLGDEVAAVAASAFLYGMGYLIFGVATGMRYYVWVITGAALAAILAFRELASRPQRLDRRELLLATTIVLLPTAMAEAARLCA